MRLIDTHCHLYDAPLGDDLPGVLERAQAADVEALIVVGTTVSTSQQAMALAQAHPAVWAAVGQHPDDESPLDLDALAELAALPRVVAVGEIGLDGSRGKERLEDQEHRFRAQLALARDHGLPALIHSRDATGRTLQVLQSMGPGGAGGILHAFAGSAEVGRQLHGLGYALGVAGVVCRPQATRIRRVLASLPLEGLVLETDAPFIGTAEVPRGAVEPAHLVQICQALADLQKTSADTIASVTTANARKILRIDGSQ